jgi:beta-lactam-binding protein with PASTA domain
MKIIRFLKSKTFWANLLVAIVACALIFWGVNAWLGSYTRHGDNVKVPALARLSFEEAVKKLEAHDLVAEILDTSEFNSNYPRSSIIDQYPEAGALVKEGRVIKLTINPERARKIEMPMMLEKTKRRAIYDLESKGFVVGELTYVPYIGKDVVVDVKVNGRSVKEREKFEKGTVVELVLGQGLGETRITMPYLRFLTLDEATAKIMAASLNIGSVGYDPDLKDTALALVYKQYPNPGLKPNVNIGAEVDIWLTDDYTKIPNDSLEYTQPQNVDTTLTTNDTQEP